MGGQVVVPGGRRPDPSARAQLEGAAAAKAAAAPNGEAATIPARADGLELLGEVAGSGHRRAPALARRADGQTVQLTPLLYSLLEAIDGKRGYAELAAAVGERIGKLATADQIRFLVEGKLRPLGLLQQPDGTEPTLQKANPLLALRLKFVVSNPAVTKRIAAPFAALFHLPIVLAVMIGFALTTWWVAFEKGLASAAHQAIYEPSLLLLVFALTLLSAGFHELGHAAACRYSGARPGAMGVGLYLVWPAFYTDVTDSYRLSRGGRLRVDLGGLYFNAIFGVGILGLWTAVRWDALLLVIAAQLVQMARQLVPIVRFDGYHILADLTGVPDLFSHIKPTLLGMLPTRWGRAEGKALKPWARAVVTGWVLVVVPLLAALLVLIVLVLPRVVATAWDSLGLHWQAVETHWAQTNVPAVTVALFSMIIVALPAVGIPYLLVRVARRITGWAWRATAGRPPLRAGAALAGAVVVAGVAWSWWPDDRYRPIEPNDRGRLTDVPRLAAAPEPPRVQLVPAVAKTRTSPASPATWQPSGAAVQGRVMLVILPRSAATEGRVVAPTVVSRVPPVPGADQAGAEPSEVEPGEVAPKLPAGPPAPAETGEGSSEVAPEPTVAASDPPPAAGTDTEPAAAGWPFPFAPPREPQEGDNQIVVVNTDDGSTAFDVALALVWVTDGSPVEQRNEAWALAHCHGCQTVAVAFQVVLVVGYAQIVTPVNAAVAVNWECDTCTTHALAVQLVATLTREPSEQAKSQIADVWAQLEQASQNFALVPLEQIHAQLVAARTRILEILARDGAVTGTDAGTANESTANGVSEAEAEKTVAPAPADEVTTLGEETDTTADKTSAPLDSTGSLDPRTSDAATPAVDETAEDSSDEPLVDDEASDDEASDDEAAADDTTGDVETVGSAGTTANEKTSAPHPESTP
jgi:putative peptide zinc metalloprotease protein